MSLCDICFSPGACCRRIQLFGGTPRNDAIEHNEITLWDDEDPELQLVAQYGLPFIAFFKGDSWIDKDSGRSYSVWIYQCPHLNKTSGRCMDYENRPRDVTLGIPRYKGYASSAQRALKS